MRVAFLTYQGAFNLHGGAETQIEMTARYLSKLKEVEVRLFDMWKDKIEEFDIVHIFKPTSFPAESLSICRYAKRRGVRIVVSPIFFRTGDGIDEHLPFTQNLLYHSRLAFNDLVTSLPYVRELDPYAQVQELLRQSDSILPNTRAELESIMLTFEGLPREKFSLIPNGVDERFAYGDSRLFKERYGMDEIILFVGNIEPRKNLLRLIRSFKKSRLQANLVIIGKEGDFEYANRCKKEASDRVFFLGALPHDSEILVSAYKAARVLVLPSLFETPGLAALEGGLAGANIVVTEFGGTKEYFGDMASYVNPTDVDGIAEALSKSFKSPKNLRLSNHISAQFLWENVARKTLVAYKSILA
ncbi:MAG: glycosyltransferase [Candidatus Bathyarchaeota archaeon]|nr:glycosyltransferase [Candidatus Bathyarchaeota archaeon]